LLFADPGLDAESDTRMGWCHDESVPLK